MDEQPIPKGASSSAALEFWRLRDELSVDEAAALIVETDPSTAHEQAPGYRAALTALINAIEKKQLPAHVVWVTIPDRGLREMDWDRTTIVVEDIRKWLRSRGKANGFFFPVPGPDYLSENHSNYSPKLAAAIRAWQAITDEPGLQRGKSVKQALIDWLHQHAHEFELTKEDGSPNQQGIEDIAKIANWDKKGGAPKTPARK